MFSITLIITIPIILAKAPDLIMSKTVILPLPYAIAFGGVAAKLIKTEVLISDLPGNINDREQARVAGSSK